MNTLSTHVLDTVRGAPAAHVSVTLVHVAGGNVVAQGTTDADGRIASFGDLSDGDYELRFAVRPYFETQGAASFYDEIPVRFRMKGDARHYHVPLLLSPWGYTTYRGS